MINANIFKAYDIRGVYGQDFDERLAYKLGLAYVLLRRGDEDLKNDQTKKLQIVVASDMRLSSPVLKTNLINGLLDAGVEVIDIGIVSTPTFYFAVANFNYDGGIMISASHNPAEWNGFKLVRSRAIPISGDTGIKFLEKKIIAGDLPLAEARGQVIERNDILAEQLRHDLHFVDLKKIKPFRIAVDPGNGLGSQYLEALASVLPVELLKINFVLDGTFPAHPADPSRPENMFDLAKLVKAEQADLGIATDGDGDRVFFVDNNGQTVSPAIIRGVLAKIFLQDSPGAKIVYDVRPGRITEELIKNSGGFPVLTHVGHSLIKEQMLKDNIYFAAESSGHFFLNMPIGCFEAPMIVIAKVLQELSESNLSLADYISPYNKYFSSGEINAEVDDKDEVLNRIAKHYAAGQVSNFDGLSVTYPDFWFNLRASNTENKIRLNLEATSEELMEEKRDEVLLLINA